MKKGRLSYINALIVIAILTSTFLQIVWLKQLFVKQRHQLLDETEHLVRAASEANLYQVLTFGKTSNDRKRRIKKIFLSSQWEQLSVAANNMGTINGLDWDQAFAINDDSVNVKFNFTVTDHVAKPKTPHSVYHGSTQEEIRKNDSLSVIAMKKNVMKALRFIGMTSGTYYRIYDTRDNKVIESNAPETLKPEYVSRKYSFNLKHDYDYQLLVKDTFLLVVYQLRFYLISSLLMLLLTCAAFYVLIRFLRQQRLFAEAKSDFTNNMTHELKTPIASISVAFQAIKKFKLVNDPAMLQSYLDISEQELLRLNLMIEKVLNLDKVSNGETGMQYQLFEVQAGLEQVINSMRLQLVNPDDVIVLNPSEEPCFVNGDKVHLTNIFSNLIENAIKYRRGTLYLEIDCSCHQGKVMISFKDNGAGIEKKYHDNVFDRFFRVPTEGDIHDAAGFGLGLHYVKETVKKHGGSIRLKSILGKGSNFIITLPSAN